MQFAQTIIHDIYIIGTFVIQFLHKSKRSWHAKEQTILRTTLVDPMFIEDSEEDEAMEQDFVEAQIMQMCAREENVVEAKV